MNPLQDHAILHDFTGNGLHSPVRCRHCGFCPSYAWIDEENRIIDNEVRHIIDGGTSKRPRCGSREV